VTRQPPEPGAAWARFYLENRRQLGAYALALTGHAADAQDLLQDVLVRLVAERRPILDARAYVLRCLRNRAIDQRRSRAGPTSALLDDLAAFIDTDAAADRETAEQIRTALSRLRDEYREVIVLKVYCELSFREVAEVLELPPGTAASHYRRGMAELKALLQEVSNDAH
jgi:RNA polymerase sigma-70 factor, ECF subfamily